ncbi:unnamed protein product [Peniophora sp. CBMAI 1063]|nr:unnamed protein product [Peniophora sp. CBMAI 1063]
MASTLYIVSVIWCLLLPTASSGQGLNFSIPNGWRNGTSLTLDSLIPLAQNAVNSVKPLTDSTNGTNYALDTWQSANLLASISQLDYVSGSKDHYDLVYKSISAFQGSHPMFFDSQILRNTTSDPLMWALAAFYGWRAYNDAALQDIAVEVWNQVQASVVVNQTISDSGTLQTKDNSTFETGCSSVMHKTLRGAVLQHMTDPSNAESKARTVGAYVALSAHLWNSTQDSRYYTAANDSIQFIHDNLYSNSSHTIQDTFDLSSCQVQDPHQWTINQGFLIEGLSVLISASDSTWTSLFQTLVQSSTNSSEWTNGTGVINEPSLQQDPTKQDPTQDSAHFTYKNALINALLETWSWQSQASNSDTMNMAKYVKAFVDVQFNALRNLSTLNNGSYPPVWTSESPLNTQVPWGQLAALPVLNAEVLFANRLSAASGPATSTSSTSPTPSGAPPSGSHASTSSRSLHGGAIAGIVVGAIAGAALLVVAAFLARRYKRRAAERKDREVRIRTFNPSAMYRQREDAGAAGELPVGHIVKDRHGYGSGQTYVGTPPLGDLDGMKPLAPSPFTEKATAGRGA